MLTDEQIKQKWIEITKRHRKGDVISSVQMAIELVRWAEAETTQSLVPQQEKFNKGWYGTDANQTYT